MFCWLWPLCISSSHHGKSPLAFFFTKNKSTQKTKIKQHPIFEEDELTLILAGAALGFAAGLVQQGLETGAIRIPNLWKPTRRHVTLFLQAPRARTIHYLALTKAKIRNSGQRIRQCFIAPPWKGRSGGGGKDRPQSSDSNEDPVE